MLLAVSLRDPQDLLKNVTWETRLKIRELASLQPDLELSVRSGRRSCQEQNELYGIGRTYNLSSAPVTYARGCNSWHVCGRAVDLDVLDPNTGRPTTECTPYTRLGLLWEQMGGVWGGRWQQFGPCGDAGHFEWHPNLSLSDVCPDPDLCEQTVARVAGNTRTPLRYLLPWAHLAAGAVVGAAVAWSASCIGRF